MQAIAKTLGASRATNFPPLFVGSVKPNIGHTEGAAGLAGVVKAVLCLEAGIIPGVFGLSELNPNFKLEEWQIAIPKETVAWPSNARRRASVNSFGFGGSNAHVILDCAEYYTGSSSMGLKSDLIFEGLFKQSSGVNSKSFNDAPYSNDTDLVTSQKRNKRQLFVFSANDLAGLDRVAASYASFWEKRQPTTEDNADLEMLSFAKILSAKISHHYFRSSVVASSPTELIHQLRSNAALSKYRASTRNRPIFVFTGQGAQRPGMAVELYGNDVFCGSIQKSQDTLKALGCDWDIWDVLKSADAAMLNNAAYSQPICTAVQIGLVDLLKHWGVRPAAVVGHSSGEIGTYGLSKFAFSPYN